MSESRRPSAASPPEDGLRAPAAGAEDDPRPRDPDAAEREVRAGWERLRHAAERTRAGGDHGAAPPPDPPPGERQPPSLASVLLLLDAARGMVPRELERQLTALLRELLLTLRAVIDWYLERLDAGPQERRVEDIPIE